MNPGFSILCDNEAVVVINNKGRSSCSAIISLLRCLTWQLVNFMFKADYQSNSITLLMPSLGFVSRSSDARQRSNGRQRSNTLPSAFQSGSGLNYVDKLLDAVRGLAPSTIKYNTAWELFTLFCLSCQLPIHPFNILIFTVHDFIVHSCFIVHISHESCHIICPQHGSWYPVRSCETS